MTNEDSSPTTEAASSTTTSTDKWFLEYLDWSDSSRGGIMRDRRRKKKPSLDYYDGYYEEGQG